MADDEESQEPTKKQSLVHQHRIALLLVGTGVICFGGSQFVAELKQIHVHWGGLATFAGLAQWWIDRQKREQVEKTTEIVKGSAYGIDKTIELNLKLVADSLGDLRTTIINNNERYDGILEEHSSEIASLKKGQGLLEQSQVHMGLTVEGINRDVGRILGKMGLSGSSVVPAEILPMRIGDERDDEANGDPAETA